MCADAITTCTVSIGNKNLSTHPPSSYPDSCEYQICWSGVSEDTRYLTVDSYELKRIKDKNGIQKFIKVPIKLIFDRQTGSVTGRNYDVRTRIFSGWALLGKPSTTIGKNFTMKCHSTTRETILSTLDKIYLREKTKRDAVAKSDLERKRKLIEKRTRKLRF